MAKLFEWVDQNKLPQAGENLRKALLAIRTFDLPMTGTLFVTDDHRVNKPVCLYVEKNGQFMLLDTVS